MQYQLRVAVNLAFWHLFLLWFHNLIYHIWSRYSCECIGMLPQWANPTSNRAYYVPIRYNVSLIALSSVKIRYCIQRTDCAISILPSSCKCKLPRRAKPSRPMKQFWATIKDAMMATDRISRFSRFRMHLADAFHETCYSGHVLS